MTTARWIVSVSATLALGVPALASAQTERGTIDGVIMDSTKAAVPGYSIKLSTVVELPFGVTTNNLLTIFNGTNRPNATGADWRAPIAGDEFDPVSLAKTITVSTQFRVDVRAEVFNLFNRVVWGAPNTNFNNNNFGVIDSQGNSPRQMQFGLKLYW